MSNKSLFLYILAFLRNLFVNIKETQMTMIMELYSNLITIIIVVSYIVIIIILQLMEANSAFGFRTMSGSMYPQLGTTSIYG